MSAKNLGRRKDRCYTNSIADLSPFQVDLILITFGVVDQSTLEIYRRSEDEGAAWLGLRSVDPDYAVGVSRDAEVLTERICECQASDGGSTSLLSATASKVAWAVHGPCGSCPKIAYTTKLLAAAIRLRQGAAIDVEFEGVHLGRDCVAPVDSQVTLAEYLRETGLTSRDLSDFFLKNGSISEEDILLLGENGMTTRIPIRR